MVIGRIYLNHQHFAAMVCVALAVHIMMFGAHALMPSSNVKKVEVHVLKVKLGQGEANGMIRGGSDGTDRIGVGTPNPARRTAVSVPMPEVQQAQPEPAAPKEPERAPETAEVVNPVATRAKTTVAPQQARRNAPAAPKAVGGVNAPLGSSATPTQYVRGHPDGAADGSPMGNSLDEEAVVMQRYTQLISMWINRHKDILNRSLQAGMRGNIVIRLRIDRNGKIHMFKLDKATGVPAVDAAAAQMVRAANPVPPVPMNYPGGSMFEFLIPVSYISQQ